MPNLSLEGVQNIYLGNHQITEVWLGSHKVRPDAGPTPTGEYIEYVMTADNSGNLYVPIAGLDADYGTYYCAYDWKVSVNGGTAATYSGTGSNSAITLSGYTSGQDYNIKIEPTTEAYQWARAYCWGGSGKGSYLKSVVYDGSYMGYAVSATDTGGYFRYTQYEGCTNLTLALTEVLPSSVTTIGYAFRESQYSGCTSLTSAALEVIPNSVSVIGGDFRYGQYLGCTSLTTVSFEMLPTTINTIGADFRHAQYQGCTSLASPATESIPTSVYSIGANFRYGQYKNCTALTSAAAEVMSNSITTIPDGFRYEQYYGCINIAGTITEVLPTSLTTIGRDFRYSQFYANSVNNYITTVVEDMPSTVTTIGVRYRREQFSGRDAISNITMVATSATSTTTNYKRYAQYDVAGLVTPATVTILGNVVESGLADNSAGLYDNMVSVVKVNSSLVSAYQQSSDWSNINDSKFTSI